MKALISSFLQFCNQILKDSMLFILCFTPILCGLLFKFGIPFAENFLTGYFNLPVFLSPYYLVFDLFFAILTPYLFCFVPAMVILGEIDDHISHYIAITPIGKSGYLISRIVFPMTISVMVSCVFLWIFSLTPLSAMMIFVIGMVSGLTSVIAVMLIITLSTNKVEGLAIAKLVGLIFLGVPLPFFIKSSAQYFAFFLPSFWIAKLAMTTNYWYCIGILLSLWIWNVTLYKKFIGKIL